jgi:predicted nucleotidyltransferase
MERRSMTGANIKIPYKNLSELCQRYHVQRLALFGSATSGDIRPTSDIDVLVVFEPSARVTFMTLGRMTRELSMLFKRPVDLVLQEGLKPVIRESILASAQEVYAR